MEKLFSLNGQDIKVQDYHCDGETLNFLLNGKRYSYELITRDGFEMVIDNGRRFKAAVSTPSRSGEMMIISNENEALGSMAGKKMRKSGAQAGGLVAPMPGKIFKILKGPGSEVKKGEPILILEAMKMEHSIRSDKDGTVKKINFQVGELVQGGAALAEVEE